MIRHLGVAAGNVGSGTLPSQHSSTTTACPRALKKPRTSNKCARWIQNSGCDDVCFQCLGRSSCGRKRRRAQGICGKRLRDQLFPCGRRRLLFQAIGFRTDCVASPDPRQRTPLRHRNCGNDRGVFGAGPQQPTGLTLRHGYKG